jgi:hypothetical protein
MKKSFVIEFVNHFTEKVLDFKSQGIDEYIDIFYYQYLEKYLDLDLKKKLILKYPNLLQYEMTDNYFRENKDFILELLKAYPLGEYLKYCDPNIFFNEEFFDKVIEIVDANADIVTFCLDFKKLKKIEVFNFGMIKYYNQFDQNNLYYKEISNPFLNGIFEMSTILKNDLILKKRSLFKFFKKKVEKNCLKSPTLLANIPSIFYTKKFYYEILKINDYKQLNQLINELTNKWYFVQLKNKILKFK